MENQTVTAGHVDTTQRPAVRWTVLLAVGVIVAGLGACRKEEQGRELHMEKGIYQGQADTPIGEETANSLRQRTMLQRAP